MRHVSFEPSGPTASRPTESARGTPGSASPPASGWRRAVHVLRMGLCGLAFLGFGVGGWVLAWLMLPLLRLWPGTVFQKQRRCQSLVRLAWIVFHDYMRLTSLVHFNHRNVRLLLTQPSVIISNHPTLVDITALVAAMGPVCFVAKASLFRSIVFGPLLRACGHICGAGSDPSEQQSALDQALSRLSAGHSVLLFPEGTRSPVDGLRRFRLGAFELARRARVPLVVIHVDVRPLGLYKGVPWYAIPTTTMRVKLRHVSTFNNWSALPDAPALCALRDRVRDSLLARCQGEQGDLAPQLRDDHSAVAPLFDMQEEFR